AMCNSYNRWLADILSGHERLKWVGVVNLDDIPAATKQVHECKRLGAVGIMILGTAGDKLLDDPSLLPFYEAVAGANLTLAIHVALARPPFYHPYRHLLPLAATLFLFHILI